ncbi:MAG: M12 family metallo-peptidase [Planctomycetota bacterium]
MGIATPVAAQQFAAQQLLPTGSLDRAAVATALDASNAAVEELVFSEYPDGELVVEVNLPRFGTATLSLFPHSVRSDRFQVLVDDGTQLIEHPAPPIRTRKGTVLEIPGSRVRGSYQDGKLTAAILSDDGTWSIVPTSDIGFPGTGSWHGIVEGRDELDLGYVCGTPDPVTPPSGGSAGGNQSFGTTYFLTEIGIDADFEFYQANGSSVPGTVNDIENVINGVEGVYEDPSILITYEITILIVRTNSADPYGTITGAGTLLNTFNNVWSTAPESQIQRDEAHLFTGVNIDGGTIGIANLSDICTSNAYGLSQSRFTNNFSRRVALTAHEAGHNWSASHCDSANPCRIMCSGLGGCSGLNPLSFTSGPINQITSYRNSRTCLTSQPPALELPFLDEFPTNTVNSTNWIYIEGGFANANATGEPSSPLSLNLDRAGSGEYQFDEIRSNTILLGGTVPTLQFYTNHSGVESGEELVVSYLNVGLDWTELDRIVSNGTNPNTFTTQTYVLPSNARHNGFRLRFYTNTNETNDDWYIDDVSITDGPPPQQEPPTITSLVPASGPTAGGTFVTINGTNFSNDVVILIGGSVMQNLSYLSATQLAGNAPSSGVPGLVSVIASQNSGSDLLDPGFLYTEEYIIHDSTEGAPGGVATATVSADHDTVISGYSLGINFDPSQLNILDVTEAGTVATNADFFQASLNNDLTPAGGWWTLGVVLDFNGNNTVPGSSQTILATADYLVDPGVTIGAQLSVLPLNGVGSPSPTENLLVDPAGIAVPPFLEGGLITVSATAFLRGDGNIDQDINVADAVFCLNFLFNGVTAQCLDAIDTNDDGATNIADAVAILAFLFSNGPPPPPPYPNPGSDPTADNLDCNL